MADKKVSLNLKLEKKNEKTIKNKNLKRANFEKKIAKKIIKKKIETQIEKTNRKKKKKKQYK